MAYITVPNSFVSGSTFKASDVNENFESIVAGLSDGTKDISVKNIETVSSGIVNSDISINTGAFSGNLSIASDISLSTYVNVAGTLKTNNIGFGSYLEAEYDYQDAYFVALHCFQSYTGVKGPASGSGLREVKWIRSYYNAGETPIDLFPEGALLILKMIPNGYTYNWVKIYSGYSTNLESGLIGIKLKEVGYKNFYDVNSIMILQLNTDPLGNVCFEEVLWAYYL